MTAAQRKVVDGDKGRRNDLAAIHMGKAALGWSEDEYRDILATVCGGVRSSGELDFAGRKKFLAHLQACGWKGRGQGQKKAGGTASSARKAPWTPRHARLWASWQELANVGLVNDRSRKALNTWAAGQTGVADFGWANPAQLDQLIESAKQWLKRGTP